MELLDLGLNSWASYSLPWPLPFLIIMDLPEDHWTWSWPMDWFPSWTWDLPHHCDISLLYGLLIGPGYCLWVCFAWVLWMGPGSWGPSPVDLGVPCGSLPFKEQPALTMCWHYVPRFDSDLMCRRTGHFLSPCLVFPISKRWGIYWIPLKLRKIFKWKDLYKS